MGELKELKPKFKDDNKVLGSVINEIAKKVSDNDCLVVGVGIAISYSNGSIGTLFEGENYSALLTAVSVLHRRIVDEFVK